MNKKLELNLKSKLNELFKEPEDITIQIELCGDKLIEKLKSYKKYEIDYIFNNSYYLTKLILRLHDQSSSMWTGRMCLLFKIAIDSLQKVKDIYKIEFKNTPQFIKSCLDLESLIEMYKYIEKKEKGSMLNSDLIKYIENIPSFKSINKPIPQTAKIQHKLLISQVTDQFDRLSSYFYYEEDNNLDFNLKHIIKYDKIKNF